LREERRQLFDFVVLAEVEQEIEIECQTFLIAVRKGSERKERGKEEDLRQSSIFWSFATFAKVPSHSISSLSLAPPSLVMP